jgi:hypothetical protein
VILIIICRVYLVGFTEANFIKCLKIIEKKDFNEGEWKISQMLLDLKNRNIIDYDSINEIIIKNKEYVVIMLEYANAGVYLIN